MSEATGRRRSRHLGPYKDAGHVFHPSLADFFASPPRPALHTIKESGRVLDLLYEDSSADASTLLVTFPAAMTIRHRTFPYFNGRRAARNAGLPILAFSDPAFALSSSVLTGWTLGDSSFPLHRSVPRIIDSVRRGRDLLFMGISAGGFPALHFSNGYPDSICLAVNPRTALFTPPTHLHHSAQHLFPGWSMADIAEEIPTTAPRASNRVIYAQNASDFQYVAAQMLPYLSMNSHNENVRCMIGDWGEGHVPMAPEELSDLLTVLGSPDGWETLGASRARHFATAEELAVAHAQEIVLRRR